jgi:hypothetical protein
MLRQKQDAYLFLNPTLISTEDQTDRFWGPAPGSFPVGTESQFLSKSLKKGITGFLRIPAGKRNLGVY